ncbi:ABC transporter substrate-binding protein [Sporosarcina limicola]|uniref:Iron complex transport system substrate-binding protein n=1 Tax=Sporosarcina limicola TaxID=34101 RepID=A0A927RER6_9BACL|nr:ABC transporter substrate-binding protein [Sporosarcina limicola]MBE1556575.1 iron complex transport system substrate-binding protein [Sporosarcina limicola]
MAMQTIGSIRKIRWLVVLLAIMVSLAGCGDAKETSTNGEDSKQKNSKQENNKQENSNQENSNQENSKQKNNKQENNKQKSSDTRKVKDAFGEVEVPVKPQRVAGIYLEDYMLALGVEPIVQWYHPNWGKQDYLGLTDVPLFDITGSLEAMLENNPDLIILNGGMDDSYQLYSKIAPTYRLPDEMIGDAEETLKTIADLLGIPEKATSVLGDYKQKVADTKEKLEEAIGRETVAVVRLDVGDKPELRLFGLTNAYTGMIYKDLGLEPFPWVNNIEAHDVISQEKIPEFSADHIIIFPSDGTWDSQSNEKAVALLDDPLWKSIPAVKNGHVYQLERSHWQSGAITANRMKMDDLVKFLVK